MIYRMVGIGTYWYQMKPWIQICIPLNPVQVVVTSFDPGVIFYFPPTYSYVPFLQAPPENPCDRIIIIIIITTIISKSFPLNFLNILILSFQSFEAVLNDNRILLPLITISFSKLQTFFTTKNTFNKILTFCSIILFIEIVIINQN